MKIKNNFFYYSKKNCKILFYLFNFAKHGKKEKKI